MSVDLAGCVMDVLVVVARVALIMCDGEGLTRERSIGATMTSATNSVIITDYLFVLMCIASMIVPLSLLHVRKLRLCTDVFSVGENLY